MSVNDPRDLKRVDQQIRLNELKAQAEELTGGEVADRESADCPPDLAEQLLQNVVELEQAGETTHFKLLQSRGVELPPPRELTDEQLGPKLDEMFQALAQMSTYVCSTDHLSDRALYELLWSDVLHEWTVESPPPGLATTLDLVSGGSAQDIVDWLRYYADDESRSKWQESFPDEPILPRQKPPFDRDRRLPKPPAS